MRAIGSAKATKNTELLLRLLQKGASTLDSLDHQRAAAHALALRGRTLQMLAQDLPSQATVFFELATRAIQAVRRAGQLSSSHSKPNGMLFDFCRQVQALSVGVFTAPVAKGYTCNHYAYLNWLFYFSGLLYVSLLAPLHAKLEY